MKKDIRYKIYYKYFFTMIIPFITFAGEAAEAIAFYESVFEVADKKVFYYRDMPEDMERHFSRDTDGYVMHSEMTVNGTRIWICDTVQDVARGDMVTLSVPLASREDVRRVFDKLKEDGTVLMELAETFYSPLCGDVKDKFGVIWHLICQ